MAAANLDPDAVRPAAKAGSWYESDGEVLGAQLRGWLEAARAELPADVGPARAVIAPHAGYAFSGPTAAFAYAAVDAARVSRVLVLGPSHRAYLEGCALSRAAQLETPVGPLRVDAAAVAELAATGRFGFMDAATDEAEHSIEMHLPYLRALLGDGAAVVPVLVGALSGAAQDEYGRLLAPYLADAGTLVVVSSDFCHWGRRFEYQPAGARGQPPHEFIEQMDRRGMALIEAQDARGFAAYLRETRNTICGRHPIGVLLSALGSLSETSRCRFQVRFTRYAQSAPARTKADSSVSYASGVVVPAAEPAEE